MPSSNALERLGTNAISTVNPTVTIATLGPLHVTSAESFWYVLQCIAFGSPSVYFAKVPMKKALSEVA